MDGKRENRNGWKKRKSHVRVDTRVKKRSARAGKAKRICRW